MKGLIKYLTFTILAGLMACGGMTKAPLIQELPAEKVSYLNSVQPIMKEYCVRCHSGGNPAKKVDLTSYDLVRYQTEKGALLKRINDAQDPMPKGGLMPENLRAAIIQWAQNGYKENTGI